MMVNNFLLEDKNYLEISEYIKNKDVLFCSISTQEPIGKQLPISICSKITNEICLELSNKFQILQAPAITYTYSTPFKSFEGVISTKKETFIAQISDFMRSVSNWGIKKIIFVDGSMLLMPFVEEALKRYKKKLPNDFGAFILSWQHLPSVGKFIKQNFTNLDERWRRESAIHVLANELFSYEVPSSQTRTIAKQDVFTSWKKRGMDPEKFKIIAPDCILSKWDNYEAEGKLFPLIIKELETKIELIMEK